MICKSIFFFANLNGNAEKTEELFANLLTAFKRIMEIRMNTNRMKSDFRNINPSKKYGVNKK